MKIRNGFVSNSSSSSFLIYYRKSRADTCDKCGRRSLDPIRLINSASDYDSEINAEGHKAVTAYIKDTWSYTDDSGKEVTDEYGEELLATVNALEEEPGWEIAMVEIDYHNEMLRSLLRQEKLSGTLKILGSSEDL